VKRRNKKKAKKRKKAREREREREREKEREREEERSRKKMCMYNVYNILPCSLSAKSYYICLITSILYILL